ncbi:MAG TPA: AAA family ATPase [Coleofasciculaceae cyanobacterium]|jgi:predicted ATPase/signal transduction histidine kinase/tRNA A-37 threonylcarbamoyl transferase component Bud32
MIAPPGIEIHAQIYSSANSVVYRGIRTSDHAPTILKALKEDYPTASELIRYKQEYEITRSLDLEGVIQVYDQITYERSLVMLLEDFGGESLEKLQQQTPEWYFPMPLAKFLYLAIQLTKILGSIHAANIIHKDINPSNIVLNPATGIIKIIDFGIATRFSHTTPDFKNPNVLEGTLAYISPEQTGRMNRMLDYRTDFYSLGATFYELLTGQVPFLADDVLTLVHCHVAKQPMPPHEMNPEVPVIISNIILKLMAKNAEERYQSAIGIQSDLEACLTQLENTHYIAAFQLGTQDVCHRFQTSQKLYGREAERASLLATFERMASENLNLTPSLQRELILVSGYSGIGKSALVQEVYKPITQREGHFIAGKFNQFGRNSPYSAIAYAFRCLILQLLGEPEAVLHQWREKILLAVGVNGQVVIDVIPEVEWVIGVQPSVPEVGSTEAQNRFNLVFQKFICVFCAPEHPLVIFLDDLQWVDSATLKLIETIVTDVELHSLLLIGAYRDNEVDIAHPLILLLRELQNKSVIINHVNLAPLQLEDTCQLIAETLRTDVSLVAELANLVQEKTLGNPFFVDQFLKTLYTENLIWFDMEHRSWSWDFAQIAAQNFTDNVVQWMIAKLKRLPKSTQQILQLAACIGANFSLITLTILCDKSAAELSSDLTTAVQAGVILPISELDEQLLIQDYKFLHDQVQQAAYALVDENQKQAVHLQIGRGLWQETTSETLEDQVFTIADHLNQGIDAVTEQAERDAIAQLNLQAGQKAKAAIAYSAAKTYLTTGRVWLAASSWQTNYELTLALYSETAEIVYLCGEFEHVEHFAAIVLQEAKTILDTVKVYEVKIQVSIAQGQPLIAVNTALQFLQQLGIHFPGQPNQSDIQLELDTITSRLSETSILNLIHLPEMTEPDKLAAMRVLSGITSVAYIAAPDLMPLFASKQVNLSIQYGNAFASPVAYATFGLILCGMVKDIESGYQFGQLALRFLSHPDTHSLKAKILMIVYGFIIHWKEHNREILKPLLEGYQSGLETGDLEHAAYCAYAYCAQSYRTAKQLVEVERDAATYSEAIRQIKQKTVLTWIQVIQQTVLNLMKSSVNPTRLIGEVYNEENRLPQQAAANDGSGIFYVYFNKLFLCYLFSEYAQAVENSAMAERYLIHITATPFEPLYYFYSSLARLATYPGSSAQTQEEILKKVAVSQEQMKQWADYAPMNHLHKYYLVQAEIARVVGQLLEAEEFYEQAIQGSKDNSYLQEEALAYELAAKFYLNLGREKFAQTYMKEAHYCYDRWGAKAKVKDLENRYPQLLHFSQIRRSNLTTIVGTTSRPVTAIDLAAVMKAAQALSEVIHLDQLIATLMQVVLENAGAERGSLILLEGRQQVVVAQSHSSGQCNLEKTAVVDYENIPISIIHSVERTQEVLVLDDAVNEPSFGADPYIQTHQPRSLLCLPILKQSQLIGILYLENNLSAGIFTSDRLEVLKLLIAQAAISLENARLYERLEDYAETLELNVEQRTQALQQTQVELVQALKQERSLKQRIEEIAAIEERNRIAREIHDSLGHYLTALNVQLQAAASLLLTDPTQAQSFLAQAQWLGATAMQEVRQSVKTLRSDEHNEPSLEAAIAALAEGFQQVTGVAPAMHIHLTVAISPSVSKTLSRVVQEGLTNISKYAKATQVEIRLMTTSDRIYLEVEDNGIGFCVEQATDGFGLKGMQERITAVNGALDLITEPGKGCRLKVEIPLAEVLP